jgi:fatty acid desaturase
MRMLVLSSHHLYRNGNLPRPVAPLPKRWHEHTERHNQGDRRMLWTLFVILLIAWLVGLIGFHVVAWYIHLLLVLALVVLVLQLISGRRPVV